MADLTSPKLLPCPFCGTPAAIEEILSLDNENTSWQVRCPAAKCNGENPCSFGNRKDESIARWNRRM